MSSAQAQSQAQSQSQAGVGSVTAGSSNSGSATVTATAVHAAHSTGATPSSYSSCSGSQGLTSLVGGASTVTHSTVNTTGGKFQNPRFINTSNSNAAAGSTNTNLANQSGPLLSFVSQNPQQFRPVTSSHVPPSMSQNS